MECCKQLTKSPNSPSPFFRIIVLDYYDGAKAGILQCQICSSVYKFDMIDWDEHQDIRIFTLSELPCQSFEILISICQEIEKPKWPQWVINWQPNNITIDKRTQKILDLAEPITMIVVSTNLSSEIIGATDVTSPQIIHDCDWFSYFNLK
ncbi:MAG: hypothetical protein HY819_22490 [Acidobacteria bacterium]|nr:hypothetical protein [Acidobacteriota bacterium]